MHTQASSDDLSSSCPPRFLTNREKKKLNWLLSSHLYIVFKNQLVSNLYSWHIKNGKLHSSWTVWRWSVPLYAHFTLQVTDVCFFHNMEQEATFFSSQIPTVGKWPAHLDTHSRLICNNRDKTEKLTILQLLKKSSVLVMTFLTALHHTGWPLPVLFFFSWLFFPHLLVTDILLN